MKGQTHPSFQKTAATLAEHLNDYRSPAMPSSQRRFLMQQLRSMWPECPPFPTMEAEELAAAFAKTGSRQLNSGQMHQTSIKDIWAYQVPDKSCVALFRKDHLLEIMNAAITAQGSIPGARFSVLPPGTAAQAYVSTEIGNEFPSWQLILNLEGPDPFESASSQ
jgi:hypothetical protein